LQCTPGKGGLTPVLACSAYALGWLATGQGNVQMVVMGQHFVFGQRNFLGCKLKYGLCVALEYDLRPKPFSDKGFESFWDAIFLRKLRL